MGYEIAEQLNFTDADSLIRQEGGTGLIGI